MSAIDLSKIPPEQLAQIPAGVPPPGITPNLVNPHNAGDYILVANTILMAIMTIFVTLRFYVVLRLKKKMGPDDWSVVAAVIGSIYYFVVVCLGKSRNLLQESDRSTNTKFSGQSCQVWYPHVRPFCSSHENERGGRGKLALLLMLCKPI
jgi:hypothetical protein